jgi:hypothetical protein
MFHTPIFDFEGVPRTIDELIEGRLTSDGAGVKLTRVIGQSLHQRLDPFLMLDSFTSDNPDDYIGGFPDHPHRGFETVTYLLAGRMRHQDSRGNQGLLEVGSMQWMLVGRGVIHSEMPEQENGELEGFQLWINLPSSLKLSDPEYMDVPNHHIPEYQFTGGSVRVLLGESQGVKGPVQRPVTDPKLLDIHLHKGTTFQEPIPHTHTAFFYVYRGCVRVANIEVLPGQLAILSHLEGQSLLELHANSDAKVLLIAGRPLKEPIAAHGPFVMNTQNEIIQAVEDYQSGRFIE